MFHCLHRIGSEEVLYTGETGSEREVASSGEGVGLKPGSRGSERQVCPRPFLLRLRLAAMHPTRVMVGTPSLRKKPQMRPSAGSEIRDPRLFPLNGQGPGSSEAFGMQIPYSRPGSSGCKSSMFLRTQESSVNMQIPGPPNQVPRSSGFEYVF